MAYHLLCIVLYIKTERLGVDYCVGGGAARGTTWRAPVYNAPGVKAMFLNRRRDRRGVSHSPATPAPVSLLSAHVEEGRRVLIKTRQAVGVLFK